MLREPSLAGSLRGAIKRLGSEAIMGNVLGGGGEREAVAPAVGVCALGQGVLPYGRLKLDPCPGVREVEKMGGMGRPRTSGTGF